MRPCNQQANMVQGPRLGDGGPCMGPTAAESRLTMGSRLIIQQIFAKCQEVPSIAGSCGGAEAQRHPRGHGAAWVRAELAVGPGALWEQGGHWGRGYPASSGGNPGREGTRRCKAEPSGHVGGWEGGPEGELRLEKEAFGGGVWVLMSPGQAKKMGVGVGRGGGRCEVRSEHCGGKAAAREMRWLPWWKAHRRLRGGERRGAACGERTEGSWEAIAVPGRDGSEEGAWGAGEVGGQHSQQEGGGKRKDGARFCFRW